MPNPNVASFMIASLSKDRAIALRTRTSEVGANWVFNTNCLIPAIPIGYELQALQLRRF